MRPCLLLLAPLVSAKFTPGPGLKENPDGTYSRTYDAAAEGAAGGAGGGGEGESNPVYNVLFTIALVLAWYLYQNGKLPSLPSMPSRAPRAPPPASQDEVDEARRARLARFTGDGPARNAEAFQEALGAADPTPVARAAPGSSRKPPGVATLGSTARADGDDPDEFFGGDSTAQYK